MGVPHPSGPSGSRGQGGYVTNPGPGPEGVPMGMMMPHQQRYAGPGGWMLPAVNDRGHPEPPQQQQQQRGGSNEVQGSSSSSYTQGVPSHHMDRHAGDAGSRAPPMGAPPMEAQGGRGLGGRGMQRGGFSGGYVGPAGGPAGAAAGPAFYERQSSGSSREGRFNRRAEREAAMAAGHGQAYQGGGSYPGQAGGPEGPPPQQQQQQQQYMPGQQLHAQLPRPGGSSTSSAHQMQQQQPQQQQQQPPQQQQQYVGHHPGPSGTNTAPHAPAGQEQQQRAVGSYGGPSRHAGNNSSSSSAYPAQGAPPAAAGSAADSGSAAATPRSPAAMAPGMPAAAVMMAPRAMAMHPGFWMYPGGAAAQWPMAAYPQHYMAPYAAYGYYPAFQVRRDASQTVGRVCCHNESLLLRNGFAGDPHQLWEAQLGNDVWLETCQRASRGLAKGDARM
jgi:hypothetical protein